MPLADGAVLSNSIGSVRTRPSSLSLDSQDGLTSRFNLPATGLLGASSLWQKAGLAAGIATGRLMRLEGQTGVTASAQQAQALIFNGVWQTEQNAFGLDLLTQRDSINAPDYQSVGLQWGRRFGDSGWQSLVNTVFQHQNEKQADVDAGVPAAQGANRKALWIDFVRRSGLSTSRFGLWQFDPQIYWFDSLLSNGQRGISARHDNSESQFPWSIAGEWQKNTASDPSRSDFVTRSLTGQMGYQVDRWKNFSIGAQLRQLVPQRDDSVSMNQTAATIDVSYSMASRRESDRIKLSFNTTKNTSTNRLIEFAWTRSNFQDEQGGSIDWTLGIGQEDSDGIKKVRPSFRVVVPLQPIGKFNANLNLQYSRDINPFSTTYLWSGNVSAIYQFNPEWQLQMGANLTKTSNSGTSPLFGAQNQNSRDRSISMTLRYAQAGGRSYLAGLPGTGLGAGSISGIAFYDDNNDGRRQPEESIASNVLLWLDGTNSITTDAQGQFEFPIVRTGRHSIKVDASTVRLPYGPSTEPLSGLNVEPRQSLRVLVPLPKVSEN
jgi:hypothetical protein